MSPSLTPPSSRVRSSSSLNFASVLRYMPIKGFSEVVRYARASLTLSHAGGSQEQLASRARNFSNAIPTVCHLSRQTSYPVRSNALKENIRLIGGDRRFGAGISASASSTMVPGAWRGEARGHAGCGRSAFGFTGKKRTASGVRRDRVGGREPVG
ncbi:hypothetical protein BDK51DRAFT_26277 [Blyttiomyces helicus]|uniref:Uncharacterized protein n=1 Tax=Blyttiomyces helicus TaxID=388810 RepID=A0A4V1IRI3_9FUNG|nr:hypothetical protein BDK51DRAFT_26277 [Blyttiomyces helicus]|eukprot:RKO90157.1 hypothetical protein BDK51DRAFT_26277 [Blyttiomyces helicus]